MISAGYQHEIHYPKGIFGKLFVELGSSDHYSLIDKYHYNPVNISIFNDMDAVNCFQKIYTDAFDLQSVNQYIDTLINFNQYNAAGFDFRINIALGIMDAEIDRNFSLKSLSNHVGISPSRFQHLFKEQVGIPFTQYRLWRRIREAEIVMNQTDSLTTASLQVGFSDLPHFAVNIRKHSELSPQKFLFIWWILKLTLHV